MTDEAAPFPPPEARKDPPMFAQDKVSLLAEKHGIDPVAARWKLAEISREKPPVESLGAWMERVNEALAFFGIPKEEPNPSAAIGEHAADTKVYPRTELGNADRFVDRFGADVRSDVSRRDGWLVWDGRRWANDDTGSVYRMMEEVVADLRKEADDAAEVLRDARERREDPRELKRLETASETASRWWRSSSTSAKIAAVLTIVSTREGIPVRPEELDRAPWVLNTPTGTVDLRTGEVRPHRREDMITKLTGAGYDPKAACPAFEAHLAMVLGGDGELPAFLRRAMGYTASGSVREQVFFIHDGRKGNNGKGVTTRAFRAALGDYAKAAEPSTFLRQDGWRVRQDLVDLNGARFVATSELKEGDELDEDLIKRITGNDPIKGRVLYGRREIEREATYVLWLSTNHRPRIRGQDGGIWRRPVVIPWTRSLDEAERDRDFYSKLAAETEGILRWIVLGAVEYAEKGLLPPPPVRAATEEYQREQDDVAQFLADFTEPAHEEPYSTPGDTRKAYERWAAAIGVPPLAARVFNQRMKDKGFAQKHTNTGRYWLNLRLNPAGAEAAGVRGLREESFRRGYS